MEPDTSYFTVHNKGNGLGNLESMTFEWVGKSPYIYIGISDIIHWLPFIKCDVNDLSILKIGGHELVQVDNSPFSRLYIRKSTFWRWKVWWYKSTRVFDLIYRRIIITLAVWNLADYVDFRVPTWKDIKLFRKNK